MKHFSFILGKLSSFVCPVLIMDRIHLICTSFYTGFYSRFFKSFGYNSILVPKVWCLRGMQYITIGNNVTIGRGIQLTAWNVEKSQDVSIIIGDGSSLGGNNHITAIRSIRIGNNVLTGKSVTITDNSHGTTLYEDLEIDPKVRQLRSKGEVVIGDNVWIGDKATILPNVHIGNGSVVGANSVVTSDVPPYCVVVGNPAKVVKQNNER